MKMWQKLLSAVLVAFLLITTVLYLGREEKTCCLCNSFRYHAPCLIDLETGNLIELDLYFPHDTKVAELADPQPQMASFSFIGFGNVTGLKQTDSKILELDIPCFEKTTNPALCKLCRKQLKGLRLGRYALADLYDSENKRIIPIKDGLCVALRCYEITARKEDDVLKVRMIGNLA